MKNKNNISQELEQLAPNLAQLLAIQPFKVPNNYFESLHIATIESCLEMDELLQIAPTLSQLSEEHPFKVPHDYFETLQQSVLQQLTIPTNFDIPVEEPINTFITKNSPFIAPNNYFEQLQSSILNKVSESEAKEETLFTPNLDEVSMVSPFNTPTDYFDQLQMTVLNKVNESEEMADDIPTPHLDGVSKLNPFGTTDNYFEQLPDAVLQHIRSIDEQVNEKEEATDLVDVSKVNPFTVPTDDYFAELSDSIMDTIKAMDNQEIEVPATPTLDAIERKEPFAVPENYFNSLTANILNEVEAEKATESIEALAGKEQPFNVPKDYFNTLTQDIESLQASENIEQLVGKTNNFGTPEGYFDQLADKVLETANSSRTLQKVTATPAPKVVPMAPRPAQRSTRQAIRNVLSIAAVLALFICSLWLFNNLDSTNDIPTMAQVMESIDNISQEEAQAFIIDNMDEFADALEGEDFLSSVNTDAISLKDLGADIDQETLNNFLLDELDNNSFDEDILIDLL